MKWIGCGRMCLLWQFPLVPAVVLLSVALLWTVSPSVARAQGTEPTPRVLLPVIRADATPSSFEQIETALANGELDLETALLYTVYAAYRDPRLPQAFQGNNRDAVHAPLMDEILSHWSTLSPQTQAALVPFLTPPIYVGSWYDLRLEAQTASGSDAAAPDVAAPDAQLLAEPVCDDISDGWAWKLSTNNAVKIWYRTSSATDTAKAEELAQAIGNTIWPALVRLHGVAHTPPSDEFRRCNGDDGKFDVFLVDLEVNGRLMPLVWNILWDPDVCAPYASQVHINRARASGKDLLGTTAHELMHAFNHTYTQNLPCAEYAWWDEATATWAIDYVYKDNQNEHAYGHWFVKSPQEPLESTSRVPTLPGQPAAPRQYGAYVFPFYLSRIAGSPQLIPDVWANTAFKDSLSALNVALPDGLKKKWPEFALKTWNQPPIEDYRTIDQFFSMPQLHYPKEQTRLTLPGVTQWEMAVPAAELAHLSTRYFHYTFPDETVRSVGFYNGLTYQLNPERAFIGINGPFLGQAYGQSIVPEEQKKGAHIWAVWRLEGKTTWEPPVDWTDATFRGFCRDVKSERISDLVIIYSNSEYLDRDYKLQPTGHEPTLFLSNIGCWQWEGKVTYSVQTNGVVETVELDVLWERHSFGHQFAWPTYFDLVKGEGTYTVSGGMGACVASGGGTVSVPIDGAPQLVIYDRILSGPAARGYGGRGQLSPGIDYWYTLTCPNGTQSFPEHIDVWFEPPWGSDPEPTFDKVQDNGIRIEDTDFRDDGFGVRTVTETRILNAKRQP